MVIPFANWTPAPVRMGTSMVFDGAAGTVGGVDTVVRSLSLCLMASSR